MDSDSKSYQRDQSLTTPLSPTHETELDFEPVVVSAPPDTATSPAVPITTTPQTVSVREVYDVTAPSPSGSSDGSSNEFVKVEHSDFHQSDGSLSFKMEQLLQLHKDGKNNQEREKDQNPVENIMDHGFASEEPFSGILPRAEEFTESVIEKVTDIASTGAEKVMNVANIVMSDATKVASEALGNKTKETTEQSGGKEYKTLEIPLRDTASNMVTGIVHGISSAAEEARSMGMDVAQSLQEDVNKAKHIFEEGFDEHNAGSRTVFHEPVHKGHQVADYPTQQWGLDWRQYTNQAEDISLGPRDLNTGIKETVHTAVDSIHDQIIDVHDKVDSMIEKMYAPTSPEHDDSGAEQSMFDRKGPLTIPHQTADDLVLLSGDFDSSKQSGFELSPRPPTPPKELDDEDVKPTTIDVGQTTRKLSFGSEHPRSILKNSAQSVKFNLKDMDPRLLDIVYWRDPKKSGAILGITVLMLLVLAKFPLIAVLSYAGLSVLGGTLGFRIYKLIEAQIKKTDGTNPYRAYLEDREFHLPKEKVHQQVDALIEYAQLVGNELRRLFLAENIVESVKFGLLLWALTYVSYWFSGLSVLILALLAVFTIPKVYEVYQEPIDRNISIAKQHVDNINKMIDEKIPPFLKKPAVTASGISHEKSH